MFWELVKSWYHSLIIWIFNSSEVKSTTGRALSDCFLAFKVFPVVTFTVIDRHLCHGQWFLVTVWQLSHYYQMMVGRSATSSEFEIRPLHVLLAMKLLLPALGNPFDTLFISCVLIHPSVLTVLTIQYFLCFFIAKRKLDNKECPSDANDHCYGTKGVYLPACTKAQSNANRSLQPRK